MLKNLWLIALTIPALLIGCGGEPDPTDDDDDAVRYPILVEVSPSLNQTDFFYRSSLVAEFDIAPDSVTVTLTDADGNAVDGTETVETNGRVVTFDPTADLMSSSAYTMTVEWSPTEEGQAAFENAFQTSSHGGDVGEPATMIGNVYNIDLAGATFVDPPGIGPILQSQMDGFSVLFTAIEEGTDFDSGVLHVMGAIGADDGGAISQDACAPTLAFTAGDDGVVGTADDTPATWNNPEMLLEADELPLTIQGVTATIQDLVISGTFHPDMTNMRGGVFGGVIDTRPLVGALGSGESETEICDLVESTVGVPCISCTDDGDDTDDLFCLSILAEDLAADVIEGLTLQDRPCDVIIGDFVADGSCADEAASYDADADGTYELCPEFTP